MNDRKQNFPTDELPIGFGVALAKNEAALAKFGQMTERERRQVLFDARHIRDRAAMQALVDRIGGIG